MSKQVVDAVFENGVFRPLTPLPAPPAEGQQVRITVDGVLSPAEMTKLATSVFEGLSDEEMDEIEEIALDRSFFSNRTPT